MLSSGEILHASSAWLLGCGHDVLDVIEAVGGGAQLVHECRSVERHLARATIDKQ